MKLQERKIARRYREQGLSINDIVKKVNAAKSSVSLWVRDIELSSSRKEKLLSKAWRQDVIERRRFTRLTNENARRQIIIERAKKRITKVSDKDLLLLGTVLYWAEGSKTRRGIVEFTNGDPIMISLIMKFLRTVCNVPESKFRGYIHIHPHLDHIKAEEYWSNVSSIPLNQFYKTYKIKNKSSKNKKNSLPYGTFGIYVCDTELFLTLKGWLEKIQILIFNKVV